MLVLTRRPGEEIVIAGEVRVTVLAIHGQKVRLGVSAPRSVVVDRQEMAARRTKTVGEPRPDPAVTVPAPSAPVPSAPERGTGAAPTPVMAAPAMPAAGESAAR